MRKVTPSCPRRRSASQFIVTSASAMLVALLVFACSDDPTAPRRPVVPTPTIAFQTECVTYYLQGEVWELTIVGEGDWWVQQWYYDEYLDETVITVCAEFGDPDDPGDGGGGGGPDPVDCFMTPWAPECPPPPPPPPPCNPACGGGDPGGDSGGTFTPPDSISVSVTADATSLLYGGAVRVTATVTANNGGGYTSEGWNWSGRPGTSCGTELACEMEVIGSGWMRFTARKNQVTASDSVHITVNPLSLSVACERLQGAGQPIARGEGVDCHVADTTVFAGWTPSYLKWRFTPPSNTWGLGVVEDLSGGANFGGMVAIGGDVELSLRLERSGLVDTLSATGAFAVVARDVDAFPGRTAAELQAPGPYSPVDAHPVPDSLNVIGRTITQLANGVQFVPINFGPNNGYRFLAGYTLMYTHAITIPLTQFAAGGHYYNLAPATASGGYCSQAFVRDVVPGFVMAHEGVNRESGSHTQAAEAYLVANAPAIRNRAESVVYTASTQNGVPQYVVNSSAFDVAIMAPDLVPGYGTIPPPNGCRPRYE
jgi:hypothetical protein